MTKLIQLQDLNTNEDLSPVVSVEGLRDKDGQKVDLSTLAGGNNADVEISSTEDADLVLQDSTGAKFAEIANGVIRTAKFDMQPEQLAYLNRFNNKTGLVIGSFESSLRGHMLWKTKHSNLSGLVNGGSTALQYFNGRACNTYVSALPQDMWWYKMAKSIGMSVDDVKVLAYGNTIAGRTSNYADMSSFMNPVTASVEFNKITKALSLIHGVDKNAFGVFVMNKHMMSDAFNKLLLGNTSMSAAEIKLINNWYNGFSIILSNMQKSCSSTPIVALLHDTYASENDVLDNAMTAILTKLSMSFGLPTYVEQDGVPSIRYVVNCAPFRLMHVYSELSPKNNIDKAITAVVLSNC